MDPLNAVVLRSLNNMSPFFAEDTPDEKHNLADVGRRSVRMRSAEGQVLLHTGSTGDRCDEKRTLN